MFVVRKDAVSQTIRQDRPADYHPNLADLFHRRQMEKMIQQTREELEEVRSRLNRLEEAIAGRKDPNIAVCESTERPIPKSSAPPLLIAELKQLAEIAKRLR